MLQETSDRHAFDVFHHEILAAIVRGTRVQEPRDIRMIESGQDLAFGMETPQHVLGVDPRVEQFDRDFFLEVAVGARREIDGAHSAAPDLARHGISSDPLSDLRIDLAPNSSRRIFGARFQIVGRASAQDFSFRQK